MLWPCLNRKKWLVPHVMVTLTPAIKLFLFYFNNCNFATVTINFWYARCLINDPFGVLTHRLRTTGKGTLFSAIVIKIITIWSQTDLFGVQNYHLEMIFVFQLIKSKAVLEDLIVGLLFSVYASKDSFPKFYWKNNHRTSMFIMHILTYFKY